MTAKVRVTCPHCGTVEIVGADVMVLSRLEQWHNVYCFDCPTCVSVIVRRSSPDVVALLLRAGARIERFPHSLPPEDRGDASLPRLTHDDLIDFHDVLDRLPTADHRTGLTRGAPLLGVTRTERGSALREGPPFAALVAEPRGQTSPLAEDNGGRDAARSYQPHVYNER